MKGTNQPVMQEWTRSGTNLQDFAQPCENVQFACDTHNAHLKATLLRKKKYTALQLNISAVSPLHF